MPFEIEAAILDQNKTFYRLKVGAFKNSADADKVCNDIKTGKIDWEYQHTVAKIGGKPQRGLVSKYKEGSFIVSFKTGEIFETEIWEKLILPLAKRLHCPGERIVNEVPFFIRIFFFVVRNKSPADWRIW